jgi:hypothetical protein
MKPLQDKPAAEAQTFEQEWQQKTQEWISLCTNEAIVYDEDHLLVPIHGTRVKRVGPDELNVIKRDAQPIDITRARGSYFLVDAVD